MEALSKGTGLGRQVERWPGGEADCIALASLGCNSEWVSRLVSFATAFPAHNECATGDSVTTSRCNAGYASCTTTFDVNKNGWANTCVFRLKLGLEGIRGC